MIDVVRSLINAACWVMVVGAGATLLVALARATLDWAHEQNPLILVGALIAALILVLGHPRLWRHSA